MSEKDLAHKETDKILLALEQKINRIYANARDDMSANIAEYFASFKKREARQRKLLEQGKITEQEFKQWRLNQMARGERYVKMRDEYAERMTNANEVATAYINDTTPNIYSLNRNYTAYTIEQVAGDVGFTLYDERTVKRLIKDEPNLMPYYPPKKAIKRGIDLEYGKQKITENITSGILQGKSIPNISKSLQQDIPTMNRNSAIRTARTAATGAQNAGRMDSYHAAKEMGIKLKKQWLATLDGRTRHEHAMLDGQAVDEDKPFKVDGYEIMFPGDPSAAAEMVYNCRCTTVAQIDGVDMSDIKRRAVDPETGETVLIENMTYAEWAGWKTEVSKAVKNDSQTSELSDFDKFRFGGLNATRTSNKYYEMDRVAADRVVVKVGEESVFKSQYGYGLILDDSHVCWLKDWQVSESYYGTEVLITEKYFQAKKWGTHSNFGIIEENYKYSTWKKAAQEQQEAGTQVKWKVDGATRMLESFKKQAERKKKQ